MAPDHALDVEAQVTAQKAAADAAVTTACTMMTDLTVDDAAASAAGRQAQIAVDTTTRDAVNLCGLMLGRWRKSRTQALRAAAERRWGREQTAVVPLDHEPLGPIAPGRWFR